MNFGVCGGKGVVLYPCFIIQYMLSFLILQASSLRIELLNDMWLLMIRVFSFGAIGCSSVCGCGIVWSYSHTC